jgi:2-polyprenyl-3-methyl-5-hydroxy-6-metoxy-1,4-benzoquinol methylase
MRVGARPTNLVERLVVLANGAPVPILETQLAFTMARAIMAGVELGVFAALRGGPRTAEQVAQKRRLHPRATTALLHALVGCDYLSYAAGSFALRPVAEKWLLDDTLHSLANKMRFQLREWEIVAGMEEFVRRGTPHDLHGTHSAEEWRAYQLGMIDLGRLALAEVLRRAPLPRRARDMLDIGGSGGTYSAAFVRARPGLRAVILDLPDAVVHARPVVLAHGLGDRLTITEGDVLTAELGAKQYDFVFMANVAHHLSAEENALVARRATAALRPGGVFCVHDIERSEIPSPKNQLGGLMDLYFAMTSRSGTWTEAEVKGWLAGAGLDVRKSVRFRRAPGLIQVWGVRRR